MLSRFHLPAHFPQTEVSVGASLQLWEVVAMLVVVGGLGVLVALPLVRVWARRLERPPLDQALTARLEQLERTILEMKRLGTRMAELEQRVEFAERLLPRPERAEGTTPEASPDNRAG